MAKAIPTVGLIDDDPSLLKALGRMMRSRGFAVSSFSSGTGFLESFATSQPDCIVLDLEMPEISGLDLQELLLSSNQPPPLIFVTAHEDPEAERLALRRGAIAFFHKPVRGETLCATIRSALEQQVERPSSEKLGCGVTVDSNVRSLRSA
jgi:FixJ family two-component response regulator